MKIEVKSTCDGNGVCMGIAPDIFDVDDDLKLHVAEIPDDEDVQALVRQAVTACPILALKIIEE